jgi:hypothetical protein
MAFITSNSRLISTGNMIKSNTAYSWTYPLSLQPLRTENPSAGKRVKMSISGYNAAIYYTLTLPLNYKAGTAYSVIFECPGNVYGNFSGLPDDIVLGYGLSLGLDFILVQAPFVNTAKTAITTTWWSGGNATDDPTPTIETWTAILDYIEATYNVRNVILTGFSRGAIACCYVGCYNDTIATRWDGFIADAHFDGQVFTVAGASTRLARINNKKTLFFVGSDDSAKANTVAGKAAVDALGFPTTYIEKPSLGHDPTWILLNDSYAVSARTWINQFK